MRNEITLLKSTFPDYIVNRHFTYNNKSYYLIFDKDYKKLYTDYSSLVKIENGKPIIVPFSDVDNLFSLLNSSEVIEEVNMSLK